jgi:hypothetical protein
LNFQVFNQAINGRCFANLHQLVRVSELFAGSGIRGSDSCFPYGGINHTLKIKKTGRRGFLIHDLLATLSSKLRNSKRCEILFAPEQMRHGRNDIVLERAIGDQFGNQILVQLLEFSGTFPREDAGCSITPMFEGRMIFLTRTGIVRSTPYRNESLMIIKITNCDPSTHNYPRFGRKDNAGGE